MEKYLKRCRSGSSSSSNVTTGFEIVEIKPRGEVKLNLDEIVSDPGLRKPVDEFDVNVRDEVRREYMARGPCQLVGYTYPRSTFGIHDRSFQEVWYRKFPWLEYSESKDAAFCFWCYLFKQSDKGGRYAVDAFTKTGFCNWKRALEKFNAHVGAVNSCHNNARIQFEAFQDQIHSTNMLESFSREMNAICRARLTTLLDVTRFILKQGWPFYGVDEFDFSSNRGNFVELLDFYIQNNPDITKVLSLSAPENSQMTTLETQKQFVHAFASEITLAIVGDIGDKVFTLLVDGFWDISIDEHIGIFLRCVNDEGYVIERLLAIMQPPYCKSDFLKGVIDALFAKHDLSFSKLRGLGYNGGSGFRREFNKLKSLILQENPYAMYGHCFSCQLQLIIFALGKEERLIVCQVFDSISMIVNTTGAVVKMADELKQSEHERLVKELDGGEADSEDQDTRWGSYYLTLLRLCSSWPSIEQVLINVSDNSTCSETRMNAERMVDKIDDHEFVFLLHLMRDLLGITHELSLVLQQKEKGIIQALSLISSVKYQLQRYREDGWETVLDQVNKFCELNQISLIDMDGDTSRPGKRQFEPVVSNYHHYHVRVFCQIVDSVIQEMNDLFSDDRIEVLRCIACLDPRNSFSQFNVDQLMHFASLYKEDFSADDYLCLPQQLSNFVANMRHDSEFSEISSLASLAMKMVETGKSSVFPLVYRLIELALVLPITTASVERAFSAMETIRTHEVDQRGDEWRNATLIAHIEHDVLSTVENEQILRHIQLS
ncbi:zinc finger MYM-type protein 1-like [Salvia splendens]|uniref:zinc finger MYM-type protein 1-like n=1 Tax=Salvia splendens TaxID=180675 RepID=UPI001C256861|nr:zinc finger MYM-type protein 1-like [Salvia splendens]